MWVKICANTNLADARLAAELGANAVGFVFASSKRQVTPEQVAEITPLLPPEVLTVGVFGSRDADEIVRAANVAHLGAVQLHSRYDPELVGALQERTKGNLRCIQVVSIEIDAAAPDSEDVLLRALEQPLSDRRLRAVLLDAAHGGASGGLGRSFAWSRVAPLLTQARRRAEQHRGGDGATPYVIVAGGLRPENVGEAIRALRPEGVDVASGVETSPGRKDPGRLAAFIRTAQSEA